MLMGGFLMSLGHFFMVSEKLFVVALFLLITGNGLFKPNISTLVGRLYSPTDSRRDRVHETVAWADRLTH